MVGRVRLERDDPSARSYHECCQTCEESNVRSHIQKGVPRVQGLVQCQHGWEFIKESTLTPFVDESLGRGGEIHKKHGGFSANRDLQTREALGDVCSGKCRLLPGRVVSLFRTLFHGEW